MILDDRRIKMGEEKVLFLEDNARMHISVLTVAKTHKSGYELLPQTAYSLDLAPCGLFSVSEPDKMAEWEEIWVERISGH